MESYAHIGRWQAGLQNWRRRQRLHKSIRVQGRIGLLYNTIRIRIQAKKIKVRIINDKRNNNNNNNIPNLLLYIPVASLLLLLLLFLMYIIIGHNNAHTRTYKYKE